MKDLTSVVVALLGVFAAVGGVSAAPADDKVPTFTKDVAPILQQNCQVCHRPGSIGPMSLLTYEEARPWARSIKQRVVAREMPPWLIDRHVGVQKIKGDRSISDAQVATIAAWVDGGAPMGNPADMPPPREFTDMDIWSIGKPDLIVQMNKPFTVPATGPDLGAEDGDSGIEGDTGLTEPRYIKSVEAKPGPGAFQVVHHIIASLKQQVDKGEFGSGEPSLLVEYALGKNGDTFPDGTGRLIKPGAKVGFGMHYHPMGVSAVDRSRVAFKFYPKGYVPQHYLRVTQVARNRDMDIPAGDANVRIDGYEVLPQNTKVTGFQPHMHNRGKRQCLEAIYPDGHTEMLSCANWDFGWHIVYNYEDDAEPVLPKGTTMHTIGWYDNSAKNKWNPDPRNWVGQGQRTIDDMAFVWMSYYYLSDEEYAQELKAHSTKTSTQNNQ